MYALKKKRVLVAMSGGIDSSMSAILLKEEGYEVIGITMKTWSYDRVNSSNKKEIGCCSLDSINDARKVGVDNKFSHYVLDIRDSFKEKVIDYFVDEYLDGRTPNPCVMCNTHIKWKALFEKARYLNCSYVATGHYASIKKCNNGRYTIAKAIDNTKDQSYALWGCLNKI